MYKTGVLFKAFELKICVFPTFRLLLLSVALARYEVLEVGTIRHGVGGAFGDFGFIHCGTYPTKKRLRVSREIPL